MAFYISFPGLGTAVLLAILYILAMVVWVVIAIWLMGRRRPLARRIGMGLVVVFLAYSFLPAMVAGAANERVSAELAELGSTIVPVRDDRPVVVVRSSTGSCDVACEGAVRAGRETHVLTLFSSDLDALPADGWAGLFDGYHRVAVMSEDYGYMLFEETEAEVPDDAWYIFEDYFGAMTRAFPAFFGLSARQAARVDKAFYLFDARPGQADDPVGRVLLATRDEPWRFAPFMSDQRIVPDYSAAHATAQGWFCDDPCGDD